MLNLVMRNQMHPISRFNLNRQFLLFIIFLLINNPNSVIANLDVGVNTGDEFRFKLNVIESTEGEDQFVYWFNHYTESLGYISIQNGDEISIKILDTTQNDGPPDTICKAIPVEINTNTMNYCLDSQLDIFLHHTNWDKWEQEHQIFSDSLAEYGTGQGEFSNIENDDNSKDFKVHWRQNSENGIANDDGTITRTVDVIVEKIVIYDKDTGVLNYYKSYKKSTSVDQGDVSIIQYEIINSEYDDVVQSNDFESFPYVFITLLLIILFFLISINRKYSVRQSV
ncbi:MAG: hypothetical protein HeimC2_01320 [Candidatus Heimdallarchaeota archaeon LC_2]|nr:MAG: hypothetical protein HeimC2_01320 [Candidatus Heimdallarchaeota archaeon LC_2]